MRPSRRRAGPQHVAALALVVLTAACGEQQTGTSGAGAPSTASTSASASPTVLTTDTGASTEPATTPAPDDTGDDGFAYLPWGPDDPPVPGQYAALAASTGSPPRCDDLADQRPDGDFWETALAVCRVLVTGAAWPDVADVPAPPDAVNAYQSCLDQELRAVLQEALRWHAEHPSEQPRVTWAGTGARSPCQDAVYAVSVLDGEDAFDGEADQGGRVPVAITLAGADPDAAVTVAGQAAELTGDYDVADPGDGLTTLVVLVEPPARAGPAPVEVSTPRGPLRTEVDLPGPDDVGTPPPSAPDDEVVPDPAVSSASPGDDASADPGSG